MTSLLSTSPTEAFLSGQTAPGTPTSKAAATPMIDVNEEFLRALPKTDLHVHLDGSLRINTLIDLSKKDGKELPAYDEAGLRKLVFKDTYSNLEEYLQGFMYTSAVMQSAENMERIAFEFAEDNYSEGVRYFEVRFAPQLHADAGKAGDAGFDILQVLTAVNAGLKRAKNAFNSTLASPEEPPYEYGIIVCAMRMFEPFFSRYFTELTRCTLTSSQTNWPRLLPRLWCGLLYTPAITTICPSWRWISPGQRLGSKQQYTKMHTI